jgi:hypothetical protein
LMLVENRGGVLNSISIYAKRAKTNSMTAIAKLTIAAPRRSAELPPPPPPPLVPHWGMAVQTPAAHCWHVGQSLSALQDSWQVPEEQVVPVVVQSLLPEQQPPTSPVLVVWQVFGFEPVTAQTWQVPHWSSDVQQPDLATHVDPVQVVQVGQEPEHVRVDRSQTEHVPQSVSVAQQPDTAEQVLLFVLQVSQGRQVDWHEPLLQVKQLGQSEAWAQQLGIGWHA